MPALFVSSMMGSAVDQDDSSLPKIRMTELALCKYNDAWLALLCGIHFKTLSALMNVIPTNQISRLHTKP